MRKILLSLFATLFAATMMADKGYTMCTLGPETILWAVGLSPDGHYMSCWLGSGIGSALYDTRTGEYYYYNYDSEFDAVTNEGMMIGYGEAGLFGYNPITEESLVADEEVLGKGVTTDGAIVVGSALVNAWKQRACYYKDGKLTYLYEPTEEELGFDPGEGSVASYVNDDGTLITGYVIDWLAHTVPIKWTLGSDGEYEYAGRFDKSPAAMSHSGNYVAYEKTVYDDSGTKLNCIGRYNQSTGEKQEGVTTINCYANGIAEDGTIIAIQSSGMQKRSAVIWTPEMDAPDYMKNVYPEVPEFVEYDKEDWNYATGLSSDGRYICGMAWAYIEGDDEEYARRISWFFDRQEYAEATGIHETPAVTVFDSATAEYFSLDGKKLDAPQKGINIVRQGDKVSKVIVR